MPMSYPSGTASRDFWNQLDVGSATTESAELSSVESAIPETTSLTTTRPLLETEQLAQTKCLNCMGSWRPYSNYIC